MALVTHNNTPKNEPKSGGSKRKLLTRGPKVEVKEQVGRQAFTDEGEGTPAKVDIPETVTIPTNVRVDNHVRNQVQALINLGYGETTKDVIQSLLSERVEQLEDSEYKRFSDMVNILEQKDVLHAASKKRKTR